MLSNRVMLEDAPVGDVHRRGFRTAPVTLAAGGDRLQRGGRSGIHDSTRSGRVGVRGVAREPEDYGALAVVSRGNAWEYRVAMRLDEFNTADSASAAEVVGLCAAIPGWVDAIPS